jgi:3-phytase
MSVSRRLHYSFMMVAAGALAGCATPEVPVATRIANALPAVTVSAKGETIAVATLNADAADDPAIWRNASDPAASLIVGTDKKAGLYVYALDGRVKDFVPAGRVNNVALARASDGRVIVVASDRNDNARAQIALLSLDPATGKLTPLGKAPAGAGEAYGICTYTPPVADAATLVQVVSVLKGGVVTLFDIKRDLTATAVRSWRVPTQAEGCVIDPIAGSLYVGEEDVGIWRFPIGSEGAGELIARADGKQLVADVEGLAIAFGPKRYLVASSQGDNAYTIYSLPDHGYVGRFRIAAGAVGATEETDGIELDTGSFGADYPGGLFIAQDGENAPKGQNFKLVNWAEVKAAVGID